MRRSSPNLESRLAKLEREYLPLERQGEVRTFLLDWDEARPPPGDPGGFTLCVISKPGRRWSKEYRERRDWRFRAMREASRAV